MKRCRASGPCAGSVVRRYGTVGKKEGIPWRQVRQQCVVTYVEGHAARDDEVLGRVVVLVPQHLGRERGDDGAEGVPEEEQGDLGLEQPERVHRLRQLLGVEVHVRQRLLAVPPGWSRE